MKTLPMILYMVALCFIAISFYVQMRVAQRQKRRWEKIAEDWKIVATKWEETYRELAKAVIKHTSNTGPEPGKPEYQHHNDNS